MLKDSSTRLPSAIARARVRLRPEPVAQKKLPAWPLMTLLYGFPALWALGVLQIAPIVLAAVMLFYLIIRGNVRVPGPMCGGTITRRPLSVIAGL